MPSPTLCPACPRIRIRRPGAVTRDMLHRHVSHGRRVVQRAVHGPTPSRHEPHSARERQYACHRGRREDRDSVPLEEAFAPPRSRTEMLRTRRVVPVQSRRHKVGVGFRGVRRGEKLGVWSVRADRGVVGEVAVV